MWLTMCKNNSRKSSNFKGCSPLQLCDRLIGLKPAIGYYSYTIRYFANNKKVLQGKLKLYPEGSGINAGNNPMII